MAQLLFLSIIMIDILIALLDPVVLQVGRPLWCLSLEAPSPLGHLSLIPDPYPPQNLPPVIHLSPINTKKTLDQTEIAYYPTDITQPTPNVHQPLYQPQTQPDSPTHIDILGFTDDRQINVLSKEFVLDKELLKYDYLKPENSDRKNQFFEEYNEQERNNLWTKYYEMMIDLQTHFSFLDFLDYHNKKISVIEKILSWTKTENHEKVYQTYPPFESK